MTDSTETILSAVGLQKQYGPLVVADVPELNIRRGEFFTIVGPSGSGKSTLLGMLTGTVSPTVGRIEIAGKDVTHQSPENRPTVMVFQSLALFPHMSVGENIGFSMEVQSVPKEERKKRSLELMDQLHLPREFYDKKINECSGGERQRIAIARALAHDPEILFFDEPLSAIDYRLRKTLEVELMEIHRVTGKTFVYVTHSLEEAMTMSDRLMIMRDGKIIQTGDAHTIYSAPVNEFVAQFLGEVNKFEVSPVSQKSNRIELKCSGLKGKLVVTSEDRFDTSQKANLIVRPENMSLLLNGEQADNVIEVEIIHKLILGSRIQYQASLNGQKIIIEQLSSVGGANALGVASTGDRVKIGWGAAGGILLR